MKRTLWQSGVFAGVVCLVGIVWACSPAPAPSSAPSPAAAPSKSTVSPSSPAVAGTPTPGAHQRTNPNVIEEDELHFVERFPKKEYIQVDEHHFRSPIVPLPVVIWKEDENYFYTYTKKLLPEELEARASQRPEVTVTAAPPKRTPVAPLTDFEDVPVQQGASALRLEALANTGLPSQGLWRASFVMVDMNGDGILDIVAPAARLGGDNRPHIYLGDGKGHYTPWKITLTEDGRPAGVFAVDYGGIAAGDIDGDGKMDFVTCSHNGGVVAYFGDGTGNFALSRKGLPLRDFSSQGIALIDIDGDGKLDILVSRDLLDTSADAVDLNQVRAYLFRPGRTWDFKSQALPGAAYSYSMNPWDYDHDGKMDLLTGSHVFAAQTLLWKNTGKGAMTPIAFPELETYAFHFATRPGTFGPGKQPAFVDAYSKFMQEPVVSAVGLNVYSLQNGKWSVHRIFRKKGGNAFLYAVAMGDLDGDGLDDVVFPDNELGRVRVFLQSKDGRFLEIPAAQEPAIDSPAQCVRLADVDGDGRLDVVVAKTVASSTPGASGGWTIYRNRR